MIRFSFILLLLLSVSLLLSETRVAVLPLHNQGIDQISTDSSEIILRNELSKIENYYLISKQKTQEAADGDYCMDVDCAIAIGDQLDADRVISVGLSKLGTKVLVQFILVDVKKKKTILADNTSAASVDDLDVVMKRIADSIRKEKPLDVSAEVDNIMAGEDEKVRRRQANRYAGISFGYLYPLEGYKGKDRIFTVDFRLGYEMKNVVVGWHSAIRYGFATNIYASYLTTKTDFCPYLGAGLGFHWVAHDDVRNKKSDGFEFIGNAGILAFRTYNFKVMLNVDYSITLNDFDDRAITLTIGLLK